MLRFSDEQMERTRNIDLVELLRCRGEILRRSGHEWRWVYRDGSGEHDSVTVHGGEWYDHKHGIGGDAIGFLQEFMGMGFKEAVAELLNGEHPYQQLRRRHNKAEVEPPKEFILPERAANMHRLYAYMTKTRLLPPDLITHFVHAKALYEEVKYHNAVFLGLDETGTACAASLKGTLTVGGGFRQTLEGSDTRYCFHHKGISGRLYVFEAPIDMLSFIAMHYKDWQQHSYIALDGLSSKALHHFLALNQQITEICLCMDNDAAGIEAVDKFRDELAENDYANVSRLASEQKDWNEDIKARRGLHAKPAQKHPKIEAYRHTVDLLCNQNVGAYAKYAGAQGLDSTVSHIRRELGRLGDDPYTWEPRLLRVATLCSIAAKNLDGRFSWSRFAASYKPYTDKGKLKSHKAELQNCLAALCRDKDAATFTTLADSCIRACVYIQTDYAADLARREMFAQTREPPEFEMSMG